MKHVGDFIAVSTWWKVLGVLSNPFLLLSTDLQFCEERESVCVCVCVFWGGHNSKQVLGVLSTPYW